jgi:hypothetical protein
MRLRDRVDIFHLHNAIPRPVVAKHSASNRCSVRSCRSSSGCVSRQDSLSRPYRYRRYSRNIGRRILQNVASGVASVPWLLVLEVRHSSPLRRVCLLLEDNRTSGNRERETLQCGPQLSDFCIDLPTTQLILRAGWPALMRRISSRDNQTRL